MYVLCLFVVLAALLITVFNSRTAHTASLGEKAITTDLPSPPPSGTLSPLSDNSESISLGTTARTKEKSHSMAVHW